MRLRQIRLLVAVAEAGSIHAAARMLGLSQPAATKSLKQMEREAGVALFQRSQSGTALTRYGAAMLTRARMITNELGHIDQELAQLRGQIEGGVSIGVSPAVVQLLLPAVVPQFHRDHPKVDVRIVDGLYPTVLSMIRDGSLDFAIGPEPAERLSREFELERLFSLQLVVATRYRETKQTVQSLKELLDSRWLVQGPIDGPGSLYEPAFVAAGLDTPHPTIQSESFAATIALMKQCDAYCVLPKEVIRSVADENEISILDLDEVLPSVCISIIKRATVPLTPVAT